MYVRVVTAQLSIAMPTIITEYNFDIHCIDASKAYDTINVRALNIVKTS